MDKVEEKAGVSGREFLIGIAVVLLAAALRWYRLADWDMWTDEVQTLWTSVSRYSIEGPMYSTAPINFWLTRLSVAVFGENELGLRFVAWLAGVATVGVFLWSASQWFGRRVAVLGGLFLTLSMWHVGWSQTGRPFAVQTLLVLLALHFLFVTWIAKWKWGGWVSASLLLLGVITHSSTAFFLAAFLAFFATGWLAAMAGEAESRPKVWLKSAIPYAVALILCLPILVGVIRDHIANKAAWNPPWNIVGSLLFYLPPWILLTALAGAFVLASRRQIYLGVLLLFLFLIPAILVTITAAITMASAAYCVASLPALAVLIGIVGDWLFDSAEGRYQRHAVLALVAGFFLAQGAVLAHYYLVYNGLKPRWKEVSEFVEQRRVPGEEFFAAEGDVVQFYLGRGNARWLGDAHLDADPTGGAWYAVNTAEQSLTRQTGRQYRILLRTADLIQVFPVHYGAKDRALAVFRMPGSNESSDDE